MPLATVGLEARLLNSTKAIRHELKGEALKVEDASNIINALLYGTAYFQHRRVPSVKDNNYILYLYQTAKDKYLQIAVNPNNRPAERGSVLQIPLVRNNYFI